MGFLAGDWPSAEPRAQVPEQESVIRLDLFIILLLFSLAGMSHGNDPAWMETAGAVHQRRYTTASS